MNAAISKKSLLLLTTLLTCGYALAADPPHTSTGRAGSLERAVERQLNRHVVFPLLERQHDMTGEVIVSFVVGPEGRLEVQECVSANEALRRYVLGKLADVDVGMCPGGAKKADRVRFVFRPEKA